jgi:hypothetical protein
VNGKIKFKSSNLLELESKIISDPYGLYVNPLSYDFGLTIGKYYFLLGVKSRSGAVWVYVADEFGEVSFLPSILFEISSFNISEKFSFETYGGEFYLMRNEIFGVRDWYERYLDDDINVIKKINDLVQ